MKEFQQAIWAEIDKETGHLKSLDGVQPIRMLNSDGTALPLLVDDSKSNRFAADVVRFAPGEGVALHTHVGAHILMVTKGTGIITYGEQKHDLFEGMIYLVASEVPHAIHAIRELVFIVIGNDHRPADSEDRMNIVTPK